MDSVRAKLPRGGAFRRPMEAELDGEELSVRGWLEPETEPVVVVDERFWTIRGRIIVEHELDPLLNHLGDTSPLAHVEILVSVKKKIGPAWAPFWSRWEKVSTDENGEFIVRKRRDKALRRFRVVVRFKSPSRSLFGPSRLTIYGENKNAISIVLAGFAVGGLRGLAALEALLAHTGRAVLKPAKYEVHRDRRDEGHERGEIDLGTFTLDGGNTLDDEVARSQGEIWSVAVLLMQEMASRGFPFRTKVGVKYPHHNKLIGMLRELWPRIPELPYANPINHTVYMIKNPDPSIGDFMDPSHPNGPVHTLMHELMHLWTYSRSRGEIGMAWQLAIQGGTTHAQQMPPFVGFHEGFAEWAGCWLQEEILGTSVRLQPLARPSLNDPDVDLTTLAALEGNDLGWTSIFATLTEPNLDRMDFTTAADPGNDRSPPATISSSSCNIPGPSFDDILESFTPEQEDVGVIHTRDMNLGDYLQRLETLGMIEEGSIQNWAQLFEPSENLNPRDLLCP